LKLLWFSIRKAPKTSAGQN